MLIVKVAISIFIVIATVILAFNSFARGVLSVVESFIRYYFLTWPKNKVVYPLWLKFWYNWLDNTVPDPSMIDLSSNYVRHRGERIETMQQDTRFRLYRRRRMAFEKADAANVKRQEV